MDGNLSDHLSFSTGTKQPRYSYCAIPNSRGVNMAGSETVMLVPASVKCDVCGLPQEKNGWLSVMVTLKSIVISSYQEKYKKSRAAVCGEVCLHVYISQNLGKLSDNKLPQE
jgi:hypothetical protein